MAGEDPNGRSLPGLWTPLHYAAWKGHGPCVAALLVAGAKVNLTNDHGSIALHHAACNGHADVAAALIEAGSGANFSDGYWRTPFSLALNRGHRRVFKLLLRAGAHLDAGRRPSAAAAAFVRNMRARGGWAAHVRRHRRVWAAVVGKCAGGHIPEVLEVDIAAFLAPEGGS